MTTVKIEERQSKEWATERTLMDLLKQSTNTNIILDRYMEQHLTKDQIEKLRNEIAGGQIMQSRSTDYQRRTADSVEQIKTTDYKTYETMTRMADTIEDKFSGLDRLFGSDSSSILGNLSRSFKDIARQNYEDMSPSMVSVVTKLGMVTEVLSIFWTRVSNLNSSVMDMYASGVVFTGGMSQLNNAAAASGLGLEKFTALMNKNSTTATTLGIQRSLGLSKAFMQATRRGVDLGMGMEEAQQTMYDYAETVRVAGRLRDMSDDQLIAGSKEYAQQLNSISQITGKRRDQLSAEILANTKKANMQVILNSLDAEQAKALRSAIVEFQKAGDSAGDLQDMTVGFLSRGFAGMSDAQRQMLMMSGQQGRYQQYIQALMNKDYKTSTRLLGEMGEGFRALSGQLDTFADDPSLIGDVARLAATMGVSIQSTTDAVAKIGHMVQPLPEDVKEMQAAANEMNVALQSLSASFTAIALPIVRVLAPALEFLAKQITNFTSLFGVGDTDPGSDQAPTGTYSLAMLGNVTAAVLTLVGTVFFGKVAAMMLRLVKGGVGAALGATLGKIPGIGGLMMPKPPDLGDLGGTVDSAGRAAQGFNRVGRGVGDTISSVLKGIASGLAAFGNPRTLMGMAGIGAGLWLSTKAFQEFANVEWEDMGKAAAAITGISIAAGIAGYGPLPGFIMAGGIAIGVALGAIGTGLAGAAWLLGNTLPTLAEGIMKFTEIDGENLEKVGIGMAGIGAGLLAIGASPVASAVGSFVGWIASLFGAEDPIDRLKRFEQLAEPLNKAAPALTNFSSAFSNAISALNGATLNEEVVDTIDQLNSILNMDAGGIFGGSPAVIGQLNDLASAIGNVADKTANLQNLSMQPEIPQTAAIDMQKKTMEFYDNQRTSNASMIALLQAANQKLDTLNTSVTDGSTETVRAIRRNSNNVL